MTTPMVLSESGSPRAGRFVISEFLAPDFYLVLDVVPDGPRFGLVQHETHAHVADPFCTWMGAPELDPTDGMDDVDEDDPELDRLMAPGDGPYWGYMRWLEQTFEPAFAMAPATGWQLCEAARSAGWDPDVDGMRVTIWLGNRAARAWAAACDAGRIPTWVQQLVERARVTTSPVPAQVLETQMETTPTRVAEEPATPAVRRTSR